MKLGSEEKALEIAKSLIKIGLTNEQIFEATKISIEEINKLRKEVQSNKSYYRKYFN